MEQLATHEPTEDQSLGPAFGSEPTLESVDQLAREKSLDKQLLIDSKKFATEQRFKSWFHLVSTLLAILVFAAVAGSSHAIWLRMIGSLLLGLTIVRMFILYHDYQHNAIFKGSKLGGAILSVYGYLLLTPPSVWKRSHNYHHQNNTKLFGASIGSFPIMTTKTYQTATLNEKLEYRFARNPLVILLGYFSVFLYGMCIRQLVTDARRHWDAPLSLLVHYGVIAGVGWFAGWQTMLFVCILPVLIATASGAYLFYAQHNFPSAKIRSPEQWSYTGAALQSSSFLKMGPIMNWFTGNIGYHHVHHLNSKIPFYRLPETMSALSPLQSPNTTTLGIRDVIGCLRLKLWDESRNRFVTFAEAKQ